MKNRTFLSLIGLIFLPILPGTAQTLHPIISELMANPLPNAAEYIELYNPTEQAIDLSAYAVAAVSASGHTGSLYALGEAGSIPPKTYWLLTKHADGVTSFYPQAPIAQIAQVTDLPRLPNKGFTLRLIYITDKNAIDEVTYDLDFFDKGVKSRRGVSLERIGVESPTSAQVRWASALPEAGYATPAQPNSRMRQPSAGSSEESTWGKASHRTLSPVAIAAHISEQTRSNKNFECNTSVYTLEGICLCSFDSAGTAAWCRAFAGGQGRSLGQMMLLPPGRYIVTVTVQPSGEKKQSRYFILTT